MQSTVGDSPPGEGHTVVELTDSLQANREHLNGGHLELEICNEVCAQNFPQHTPVRLQQALPDTKHRLLPGNKPIATLPSRDLDVQRQQVHPGCARGTSHVHLILDSWPMRESVLLEPPASLASAQLAERTERTVQE